jgi:DNA repair protein SbcD/Mre11
MSTFRFLHAADLHLDSPLHGLERYDGAPVEELRGATRRAFEQLVGLAIEERVNFVLIAGDVFDGDWPDYNTGLFFAAQMAKLGEAKIPVVLIRGNHDAASQITRQLQYGAGVRELRTDRPETHVLDDLGVAIHGQGFAQASVTTDLAAAYPEPIPGCFNIGLLHTSADGREGHANYAPCTVAGLRSRGYDYWALGHVHTREVLCRDPWILFPGNIQGRHARETGAKGCTLVEVRDGRIMGEPEPRGLDVLRWERCVVQSDGAADAQEVLSLAEQALATHCRGAGNRLVALRVEVRGSCRAHGKLADDPERFINEVRRLALEVGSGRVWVEKVRLRTRLHEGVESAAGEEIRELMESVRDLLEDEAQLQAMAAGFRELKQKLPHEIRGGEDRLDPEETALIRALLPEAEQLLVARLLGGRSTG